MAVNERTLQSNQTTHARHGVRIKTIALPAEHGGWGLLFEPVVLGLLLAPSIAGLYLAFSAVGFFLARHPLTLLILSRKRSSPRTALAKSFAALYIFTGVSSFIVAISFTQHSFVLPLLIAAPFAIVQLAYDWSGRRRVLLSELAGAIAISSLAPAIALSGGWSSAAAFALWTIMIARAVPSIVYVRTCLKRLHGRAAPNYSVVIAHTLALLLAVCLVVMRAAPRLTILALILLSIRAVIGVLVSMRVTAKQLGFSEIGFGAATVIVVVVGYAFSL
ncbi:MAG TPA: YwiC-like family protein [Pyrinomonadaceae bacterium]|jgi:hypothetical protein|nr:YwiC-like family protein [Pyrinomonadaceae bacterium]